MPAWPCAASLSGRGPCLGKAPDEVSHGGRAHTSEVLFPLLESDGHDLGELHCHLMLLHVALRTHAPSSPQR